jgi:hypothetical protein
MPRMKQPTSRKKVSAENGNQVETSIASFGPATTSRLEEEVRRRAYELYEQRGCQDGAAEQDWFRAEQEVSGRNDERTA